MTDTNIAFQINRISNNIELAYSALADKGATMPATNNSALLADTINTISTGGGGEAPIVSSYSIENGVASRNIGDISNKFKGITEVAANGMNNAFSNPDMFNTMYGEVNFCNCQTILDFGLLQTFQNRTNITGVNFCSLTDLRQSGLFSTFGTPTYGSGYPVASNGTVNFCSLQTINRYYAMQLTFNATLRDNVRVDLSNLTTVSGTNSMAMCFQSCIGLVELNISNLTTVSGLNSLSYLCSGCRNLPSVDLSNLTTVSGGNGMRGSFQRSGLTSITIPNISVLNGDQAMSAMCSDCPNLTTINFPSLTTIENGWQQMMTFAQNCPSLDTVKFPSLTIVNSYGNTMAWFANNCPNLHNFWLGTNNTRNGYCEIKNLSVASQGSFMEAFRGTGFTNINIDMTTMNIVQNNCFNNAFRDCPNIRYFDLSGYRWNQGSFENGARNSGIVSLWLVANKIESGAFRNGLADCPNLTYFGLVSPVGSDSMIVNAGALTDVLKNTPSLSQVTIQSQNFSGGGLNNFVNGHNNIQLDFQQLNGTTDIFEGMLNGTDGCEVIFDYTQRDWVESLPSYANNFGGTNAIITFQGEPLPEPDEPIEDEPIE